MKVPIFSIAGEKIAQLELPTLFSEPARKDLIKRAVLALYSHSYQPYGTDPLAGTRQGKATPKRRRKFGTTYGVGISRVKRKITFRRGERFGWVGAFVSSARGGIKAFPPEVAKVITEKINKKERRAASRSAIAATSDPELVAKKHSIKDVKAIPLVLENKFESLSKTKEVFSVLEKLGLKQELARTKEKKVRAGRGTLRGRKYKRKVGPLIIVSKACPLLLAARNIPGIGAVLVKDLNASLLASGTEPARLTIWSRAALERLRKEKLFV